MNPLPIKHDSTVLIHKYSVVQLNLSRILGDIRGCWAPRQMQGSMFRKY